jgi:hypothetical protein
VKFCIVVVRWTARSIHLELHVERDGDDHICGIFQLRREEWFVLAAHCQQHDIEIVDEQRKTISAHGAGAAS